ncbi:hypothetical protein ACFXBB_35535 [Streptomyces scopuliridis]|uniref:hypothetical protein n=1 Tax=Streptomyces scopuliridis TaxID=452529 RepID=UPI0036834974
MHAHSFWDVLADTLNLSPVQQRAVAEALTERQHPETAARFFARPDLGHEIRDQMIQDTHDLHVLAALLSTPVVTGSHLRAAAHRLGAETVLMKTMGSGRDLTDPLLALIDQLDHRAARRVTTAWNPADPQIRCALICAAARRPVTLSGDFKDLTKAEREELHSVSQAWHDDVWALLEPAPARPLWPALVRHAQFGRMITGLLLHRADGLDDPVLLACLEVAFPADPEEDADKDDLFSGTLGASFTLDSVARTTNRHPRALLLHGPALRDAVAAAAAELTGEVDEEGIYERNWDTFETLARVCTSPDVLRDAARCLDQAAPPTWQRHQRPTPEWTAARSQAADALALNPFCPTEALAPLASFLGETVAARFIEHTDEKTRETAARIVDQAVERVQRTASASPAPSHQPTIPAVPSDDNLAEQNDPTAALSAFLPLKGPAARRRETAQAILNSRYADASHLGQLPAILVLTHTEHAPAVAALLLQELGDRSEAWDRFRRSALRLTPNAPKTLGTLIGESRASTP